MMPARLIVIASVVLGLYSPARAQGKVTFVSLSCGYNCHFDYGEPNSVIGDVIVSMLPASAVYKGTISITPDGGIQNQFQLAGPGCAGNPGVCTLMTRGVLNGKYPVKYHISIKVDGYSQQSNAGDVANGARYFGVYGVPKNWVGSY